MQQTQQTCNSILFMEETVMNMLMAAYKAGFEGPLEMSEEVCRGIIEEATGTTESDLELMKQAQEREQQQKQQQQEDLLSLQQLAGTNASLDYNYYENVGY